MNITYRSDAEITVGAAIDLYQRSTLGDRRPVDRPDIFEGMLNNANLTVTAWHDERLVGISRSLTDFTYVAYLADLAVDAEYQRHGIGKRLIHETKQRLGRECTIVLLAAPKANGYYPKLGFEHNPRAWMLKGNSLAASAGTAAVEAGIALAHEDGGSPASRVSGLPSPPGERGFLVAKPEKP
ncbi:MAG: GNAT family N-acetyltransferase [Betaproteobacteria bacterium]|nr:GNAT family N-acetyltransferase [Betaproteobacteria bacterium]